MIYYTHSYMETQRKNSHQFLDLVFSIIIPSVILMKFSGAASLGPTLAFLLALAFPLCWGLFDLFKHKKYNFIAILGLVSVVLTGGIGLLHIDPKWLAIKEAAIPAILGCAVIASTRTRFPLVKTLLYNPAVLNVETIHQKLLEKNKEREFESRLLRATYLVSGTFFFSAVMNFVLAKMIVVSPAGSQAFNEELGRLTLLSYPAIALPSMIMMIGIFIFLWRTIRKLTGLTLEEVMIKKDS